MRGSGPGELESQPTHGKREQRKTELGWGGPSIFCATFGGQQNKDRMEEKGGERDGREMAEMRLGGGVLWLVRDTRSGIT